MVWKRQDPLASHVNPIPRQEIHSIALFEATNFPPQSKLLQAPPDMIIIAFKFFLCPGKYTSSTLATSALLTLANIQLFINYCWFNLQTATNDGYVKLAWPHSPSPVIQMGLKTKSSIWMQWQLLPLSCLYYHNTILAHFFGPKGMTSLFITTQLYQTVTFLGLDLGFLSSKTPAESLCVKGIMVLLVASVCTDIIQHLGLCHSNTCSGTFTSLPNWSPNFFPSACFVWTIASSLVTLFGSIAVKARCHSDSWISKGIEWHCPINC